MNFLGEKNKELYLKSFKLGIISIMTGCFSAVVLFNYLGSNNKHLAIFLSSAAIFFPVVIISIHGLMNGYCCSHMINYVHKGNMAVFFNVLSILLYLTVVMVVYFLSY
ncbi:MAG: hypothetical protein A2252_08670 [Elusimicrobia bacterium RIFOXYA2_FULL_39_19]|nr:MAG: hypothetical protein A2252_08670 [Elusimicrobia bacterium RIFOXYA2_FULL_39_19]